MGRKKEDSDTGSEQSDESDEDAVSSWDERIETIKKTDTNKELKDKIFTKPTKHKPNSKTISGGVKKSSTSTSRPPSSKKAVVKLKSEILQKISEIVLLDSGGKNDRQFTITANF